MKKTLFSLAAVILALAIGSLSCGGGEKAKPVTGVSLNKTEATIAIGGTETLTATVAPSNATNQNVAWASSDTSIAAVSGSGLNSSVTAIASGTALITVTTQDGNKSAVCVVNVIVPVTGISLNKATATIVVGGTETLIATVQPSDATNQNVRWSSSNSAIATVSGGVIQALSGGEALITATTEDGGFQATCLVNVRVPVTGITISGATNAVDAVFAGTTMNVKSRTSIQPDYATNKNIIWSSSNTSIATVSDGVVRALAVGVAVITATTEDGGYFARCSLTVKPEYIDVRFTASYATVNLTDLHNNDIFLVKTNMSNNTITASNTGSVRGYSYAPSYFPTDELLSSIQATSDGLDEIKKFNENPPPLDVIKYEAASLSSKVYFVPPKVGDKKMFNRSSDNGNVNEQATLCAIGAYCEIWVTDSYTASAGIDASRAATLGGYAASGFDVVYPKMTNLLGYEQGGGPYGDGGIDGNPRVLILFTAMPSAYGGYFSTRDFYSKTQISQSNQAEMFYVRADYFINMSNSRAYGHSTIIHEFAHLIHFSNMYFRSNSYYTVSWYVETFARMVQEIFSFPTYYGGTFDYLYLTSGSSGGSALGSPNWIDDTWTLYRNYNTNFGAYLMRNYGGPALLGDFSKGRINSLDSYVDCISKYKMGLTMKNLLTGYAEAYIYSSSTGTPAGACSFDINAISNINGFSYELPAIDIYKIRKYNSTNYSYKYGPFFFDLAPRNMEPMSIFIQRDGSWINRTGSVSITFDAPMDSNVTFRLYIRAHYNE